MGAAGYDVVDGVLGMANLATNAEARAELAHNLSALAGYVANDPLGAATGAVGAASGYLATTGPTQMAEDGLRLALGGLAGGPITREAASLAGSTARATAAGVESAVLMGVHYARHSVYVPPPRGVLHGGIFIPSLGKYITTVTPSMSKRFQGNGYRDPLDNIIKAAAVGEVLAVDHIYPVSRIIELPWFQSLTRSQMIDIVQDRVELGNLQPLPQSFNSSKKASVNWTMSGGRHLDIDYISDLQKAQTDLEDKIIHQIQLFNKLNARGL